jgi:Mg2+-importing ATPase
MADVGISVASAVDVAKEAAPIILLEKDLSALHQGVLEGRRSFANVMKYLMMDVSSNFGNMFSMAGAAALLPFLPLLPMQVLLNNLLYDLAQVSLPADRVDAEDTRCPRRWNVRFIRGFMAVMGPVSSVFDFLTFALLLGVFHAGPALFRTGWFMESLLTQTLVIFVIRTRGNPLKSRPGKALASTVLTVSGLALVLPFLPFAAALGFVAPPPALLATVGALAVTYLCLAQAVKHVFYHRFGASSGGEPSESVFAPGRR